MKRRIAAVLIMLVLVMAIAGCAPKKEESEKMKIVTTVFPVYDWIREITKDSDSVELEYLLDNGVDLHSYQPTAKDIMDISTCDIFIYIGGNSDKWVADALRQATNKDMTVIDLMEALGEMAKEEEIVDGMEGEEEEEEEEEGPEYDEHIWLSLRNADFLCRIICDAVCKKDPGNEKLYRNNLDSYSSKLTELDRKASGIVEASDMKVLLFGDRFPFRYFTDDYGLTYYAAFVGCSAETEASFETIIFLAKKTDELGLKHICKIESSDGSIAKAIINATTSRDQDILSFDSIQSMTDENDTYLGIMEENIDVLKEALKG